jgi:hypothetical protein
MQKRIYALLRLCNGSVRRPGADHRRRVDADTGSKIDGGTLIFGSPGAADKINALLIKAGLYNVYLSFAAHDNQGRLQIGAIPPYLQITSLLEAAGYRPTGSASWTTLKSS